MSNSPMQVHFESDGLVLFGSFSNTGDFAWSRLFETIARGWDARGDHDATCVCGGAPEPVVAATEFENWPGRACRVCRVFLGPYQVMDDDGEIVEGTGYDEPDWWVRR